MSKKFILLILFLTALPIALFLIFNKEETAPPAVDQVELPSDVEPRSITIPVPGTTGSTSQQCAVCAQISDTGSKEQCLKDFACS
jgi:hypothetical protein